MYEIYNSGSFGGSGTVLVHPVSPRSVELREVDMLCKLEEIYKTPWGIVAHRREEIEHAPFGGYQKILDEEIAERFVDIDAVARMMDCHPSTATNWLKRSDARFIKLQGKNRFMREDIQKTIDLRATSKKVRAA